MDTIRPRNLGLFYDTETQHLPLFGQPSEDPRQPHIVQLGAILVDMDSREEIEELDVLIKPDGWVIPEETIAIHGITNERALAEGIPGVEAIERLLTMWRSSPQLVRVGFNESFDARMVRIELFRYLDELAADAWKEALAHDVMKVASPICKLPATEAMKRAGRGKQFKQPKLTEAYLHFFGEPLVGAHSALVDARATMRIHFHLEDLQQPARAAA